MNKSVYSIFLFLAAAILAAPAALAASGLTIAGSTLKVIEETPEKSSGLDKIYVVYDVKGVTATYHATTDSPVTWYRYSSLGGGYAETIDGITQSGRDYTLNAVEGDMGYIIEEGTTRSYFWIVNYSAHHLHLRSIRMADEQDCTATLLALDMDGTPLHYYSITGRMMTLPQDVEIEYTTQEWSDEDKCFNTVPAHQVLPEVSPIVRITPPAYANTVFHISGDKYLRQWDWLQEAESDMCDAFAVDVRTEAVQAPLSDDPDYRSNVIGGGSDSGLGGSAPADITFSAQTTEAVIHHEWQMATDPDFQNLIYRFNEQELNYTFREQGMTYVRYIGSNASGECEAYSDTYTVSIGDSQLKCPNAFSPASTPGVNDEWKVSFRSIVEFECWIFNRHGEEIFHFNDPLLGWDGRHRGKLVKPGVYYYVIDAKGADGKHYKLSGDINIINYRGGSSTTGSGTEESTTPAEGQ